MVLILGQTNNNFELNSNPFLLVIKNAGESKYNSKRQDQLGLESFKSSNGYFTCKKANNVNIATKLIFDVSIL